MKSNDGIIDIMVRAEDASKINRIVERFKLSSYDEATIRSEIEKAKNEKATKDKGVKQKTHEERMKDEEKVEVRQDNCSLAKKFDWTIIARDLLTDYKMI